MVTSAPNAAHTQSSSSLVTETLISFSQAAGMFPPFRRERPVSPSCIWRWFRHGVRLANGEVVRLEAVKVAGRHLTTKEAVRRFVAAQQIDGLATVDRATQPPSVRRSPIQRQKDSERALERLKTHRRMGS